MPLSLFMRVRNASFGRSFRTKETDEYFKKIGVDFVGDEYIPYAPKDTRPNLRRLKKEGVDFIYVVAYDAAHAILLKDAQRLGMRDDFMDCAFWYTDPVMIRKHAGQKLVANTVILTGYQPILAEQPEFVRKWYTEVLKRGENDPILACTAMIQWLDMWREVIQRTINRVGVKNVTGEACYETITTDYKGYKPICGTVTQTFSKTRTFGPSAGSVFMFEGNRMKKVDTDVQIPNLAPVEYRDKI
jgi:ABC-type branched-subunit amino acid transport system substrate-binding protein